jgi:flagellar protein FliO/FliZ
MMPGSTDSTRSTSFRPPPILIGVGILVVALGFGLPRVITGTTPDSSAAEPNAAGAKPAPPWSGTPALPTIESATERPGLVMAFARLVGGLVVVCGLCIVITRWMAKQTPAPVGTMEVLASLAVDVRCAIHLVRAGDRRLLIGTDLAGVKALTELPGRFSDLVPEPLPQPAAVEMPPKPASVTEASVVLGPVSVPMPPPPPNRDEIMAILARLRDAAVSASPPPG